MFLFIIILIQFSWIMLFSSELTVLVAILKSDLISFIGSHDWKKQMQLIQYLPVVCLQLFVYFSHTFLEFNLLIPLPSKRGSTCCFFCWDVQVHHQVRTWQTSIWVLTPCQVKTLWRKGGTLEQRYLFISFWHLLTRVWYNVNLVH